jgi:hypothetical protein
MTLILQFVKKASFFARGGVDGKQGIILLNMLKKFIENCLKPETTEIFQNIQV